LAATNAPLIIWSVNGEEKKFYGIDWWPKENEKKVLLESRKMEARLTSISKKALFL
jgi:hypothetical protein